MGVIVQLPERERVCFDNIHYSHALCLGALERGILTQNIHVPVPMVPWKGRGHTGLEYTSTSSHGALEGGAYWPRVYMYPFPWCPGRGGGILTQSIHVLVPMVPWKGREHTGPEYTCTSSHGALEGVYVPRVDQFPQCMYGGRGRDTDPEYTCTSSHGALEGDILT